MLLPLPLLLLAGAAVEREEEDDLVLACCLGSDLGAEDLGEAVDEGLLCAEDDLAAVLLVCEGADDDEDLAAELLGSADEDGLAAELLVVPEDELDGLAAELLGSVEAGLAEELLGAEGEVDLTAGALSSDVGRATELLVEVELRAPVLLPWEDSVVERLVLTLVLPVDLLAVPAALPVVVRVVLLPEVASVLLEVLDLSTVEEAALRELLVAVLRFELRLERVAVYILSPSLLVSGLE